MKSAKVVFFVAVAAYAVLILPFTSYLKSRPVQIKVGFLPDAQVLKYTTGDQRYVVGDWAILKVLIYFGSLLDKAEGQYVFASSPDFPGMFKILQTGLKLEPYNMDAYYFAEAAFTWETGRYREVNNMLDYGMRYRTWDAQLPFFAGFNSAFFLKDYKKAAEYMKKAAEIAHAPEFATLASRYFYEAGDTPFAIMFIDTMKKSAKTENERKLYELRKLALVGIETITVAITQFKDKHGRIPGSIHELVLDGDLKSVPHDPYGGQYYIDSDGIARTTSKFSFAGAKQPHQLQQKVPTR